MATALPDKGIDLGAGPRIAQAVGLTATAFFSGKAFSQSFSTTPALLRAPAPLLAKQWKTMFDSDKALAPAIVLLGTSVFGYSAYRARGGSSLKSILYATSATLLVACVPYTYFVGEPINQKLEKKAAELANASAVEATAAEVGLAREETVHVLVDRWATMNLGRAIATGLAALLATWAVLDQE